MSQIRVQFDTFFRQMEEMKKSIPSAIEGGDIVFDAGDSHLTWRYEPPTRITIKGHEYILEREIVASEPGAE